MLLYDREAVFGPMTLSDTSESDVLPFPRIRVVRSFSSVAGRQGREPFSIFRTRALPFKKKIDAARGRQRAVQSRHVET